LNTGTLRVVECPHAIGSAWDVLPQGDWQWVVTVARIVAPPFDLLGVREEYGPGVLLPGPGVVYEITEQQRPRCYPSALTLPTFRARHSKDLPLFPDYCQ